MNRRGFLAALLSSVTLDPDRLLWQPGAKLISIPAPSKVVIAAYLRDYVSVVCLPYREGDIYREILGLTTEGRTVVRTASRSVGSVPLG